MAVTRECGVDRRACGFYSAQAKPSRTRGHRSRRSALSTSNPLVHKSPPPQRQHAERLLAVAIWLFLQRRELEARNLVGVRLQALDGRESEQLRHAEAEPDTSGIVNNVDLFRFAQRIFALGFVGCAALLVEVFVDVFVRIAGVVEWP